ncbi:cellulose synthase-like protein [Striga asiatica]|uniref:Cellulose synthase-like protein n=1 Tax=Striga asiatica TaxID=4170 RepID=A0A5A7RKE3_STRAF|nr:cellulose synthase-like protein [Striga asiatica]
MTTTTARPPLNSLRPLRRRHVNRLFAAVYAVAVLSLLRYHTQTILGSTTIFSLVTSFSLLIADLILAYMWSTTQAFRINPVRREEFPENLDRRDFPAVDIFICTADPHREPPVTVMNTALSVMAYDYPAAGKLSVYVSDDGGSELTVFALMEAAKFGKRWLPFCRENNVTDRCPGAYFGSGRDLSSEAAEIKIMYASMKMKVENVMDRGKVSEEYITSDDERRFLEQYWAQDFTRQNHPSVIKVLLDSKKDRDIGGEPMPNLIYVARQKSPNSPHHFKAGALNTLLRISASMTNSPIILTLDCDMYSNDPLTAQRALCYLLDNSGGPNCAYVQFPQRFRGFNEADIYASEDKRVFMCNPIGMDGLRGPIYMGSGTFFPRRVLFGGPSMYIQPELPELSPDCIVGKPIDSEAIGFRYGSLVEDYFTGYQLHCEGWRSIFCNPIRPAFLGDVPIALNDVLIQNQRWSVGLLEVGFSRYSPLSFGIKTMGVLMAQSYAHYAFWPIWAIPITVYAFIPSLCLLQGIPIFPKTNEPTFFLYAFLFIGAYAQDCFDFVNADGTLLKWWSDQRKWLLRGLSSFLFGFIEYVASRLGMAANVFNVTSKVMDDELRQRYNRGTFEFGVESSIFVPLATAAIINLVAFVVGFVRAFRDGSFVCFFVQMFIAGFGIVNGVQFYEAMVLRRDEGRMPASVTITSALLAGLLYGIASLLLHA